MVGSGCDSGRSWYLVHSKPRQEHTAKDHLERQGYSVYLPLARPRLVRKQRRISAMTPLFPRYLFIHLDNTSDNWSPIRSTRGVSTIVRFGYQPAQVPDALIQLLKSRENTDGFYDLPDADFRVGDGVRIDDGPMQGYEGIFLATSGEDRVLVLLNIMGREVKVKMDSHLIALAS